MVMMTRFKILALISLCLSLTLAGCGRKGSLDDPSAPPAAAADAAVDPAAVAATQLPEQPESDKSFFLDFLIN
ncbi:MAG: lipoprotein [Roseibium sp.]|uniref:LPS translocon maturation chaperone LptM n=1 Tax=Roseibium sp. TaxID=1936156 RepID=UPI00261FD290|nr:lipoprotein [Roseibium sp.]MCV0429815.1 lipoprotein [Roseibium sp.]